MKLVYIVRQIRNTATIFLFVRVPFAESTWVIWTLSMLGNLALEVFPARLFSQLSGPRNTRWLIEKVSHPAPATKVCCQAISLLSHLLGSTAFSSPPRSHPGKNSPSSSFIQTLLLLLMEFCWPASSTGFSFRDQASPPSLLSLSASSPSNLIVSSNSPPL